MLGYIIAESPGAADRCLADLVDLLGGAGIPVAGVIQTNTERTDGQPADMDLGVIGTSRVIRISQTLGPGSTGCRLDPAALEEVVGLVAADLDAGRARLLLINRFGRQEAEGRGFRPLIGRALAEGVAVLTVAGSEYLEAFRAFAGGMEDSLPADAAALCDWCREACAVPVSPE